MPAALARIACAAVLCALPATAQEPGGSRAVLVSDLLNLHRAGLPEAALLRVLERRSLQLAGQEDLRAAREGGLPATVVDRVEQVAREEGLLDLTLQDVLDMVGRGRPEQEIVQAIRRSGSTFRLTEEQLVGLVVDEGLPASVVKALRDASRTQPLRPPAAVTLDDLMRMVRAEWSAEQMLMRIREVDARFEVDVDAMADLAAAGAPQAVLSEVWARRRSRGPVGGGKQDPVPEEDGGGKAPEAPAREAGLRVHKETSSGFSLAVPASWTRYNEKLGRNNLLSFSPESQGDAEAELQVARFRSRHPDRLTSTNLVPIAENFLNHLKLNLRKRGLVMVTGPGRRSHLAGRPAVTYEATTTSSTRPTQKGEVHVTWAGPYVYLLSYAADADRHPELGPVLQTCLRSFTLEAPTAPPTQVGTAREKLEILFETWKRSVATCDYAAYRSLLQEGSDSASLRAAFVDLHRRLGREELRLALGDVHLRQDGLGAVTCRVLGPEEKPGELELLFVPRDGRFQLRPSGQEAAGN